MDYDPKDNPERGIRARIARLVIEEDIKATIERLDPNLIPLRGARPDLPAPGFEDLTPDKLEKSSEFHSGHKTSHFNVGIVGGGMAGLYTAMILSDLGIPYEVLERSGECGGRVWTYYFSNKDGDYYDVGAMRFPQTDIMRRTWDLFDKLGIVKDTNPNPAQETLIPYYFKGPNNPLYYNDRLDTGEKPPPPPGADIFGVSVASGGLVPNRFVEKGYEGILNEIFDEWKRRFATPDKEEFRKVWSELMELDAKCVTVRSYMSQRFSSAEFRCTPEESYYIANWCETMDAATNHYDASFVALLLHSLEFDYPLLPTSSYDPSGTSADGDNGVWWCINGGTSVLTRRMLDRLDSSKILINSKVTAINTEGPSLGKPTSMAVTVKTPDGIKTKKYSYVITTCTTSALQIMDLRGAQLKYSHREAIRVLRYDNSVKVGMKFKTRWWADNKGITRGGLGKTDRPTRVIVYPSYALDTPPDDTGVLLACYNWAQDASRLGSYSDDEIVSLVIADLAIMHNLTEPYLQDQMICSHVHDWNHDSRTAGAFGLFGPGQFSTLYPKILKPTADSRLIFAGELTSIYHGWIVASLNSSFRAVYYMLLSQWCKSSDEEKPYIAHLIGKLLIRWGGKDKEPVGGREYDIDPQKVAGWHVFLGTREEDV